MSRPRWWARMAVGDTSARVYVDGQTAVAVTVQRGCGRWVSCNASRLPGYSLTYHYRSSFLISSRLVSSRLVSSLANPTYRHNIPPPARACAVSLLASSVDSSSLRVVNETDVSDAREICVRLGLSRTKLYNATAADDGNGETRADWGTSGLLDIWPVDILAR